MEILWINLGVAPTKRQDNVDGELVEGILGPAFDEAPYVNDSCYYYEQNSYLSLLLLLLLLRGAQWGKRART